MKMDKPLDKTSVLIVATSGSFLAPFIYAALNIALPQIGREFAMDAISLSWVPAAFMLTSIMFIVPFGRIADIYGRKKIYTWGMISTVVTSLLLAVSNSSVMLIALQFAQGAGSALVFSTAVAIVIAAFPGSERGRVLGFQAAAVYFGLSMGPFLGGLLTQYFGWRSIFWAIVPLGLGVIALIFWRLKGDWVEAKGERFDIVGSIIYSLMLVAIVYGFTHVTEVIGVVLIGIGLIGLVTFVIWETKTVNPVLEIDLFRKSRVFTLSCLAALVNYGSVFAVGFLLSLYLQYIKGFSPQNAGFILVAQPIMQAIFSPLAGRLSDRIQPRIVSSAGMTCTVIGLLLFVFLSEETATLQIVATLALLGFGFALFVSPNVNAAMSSVEKKYYGVASAIIATMRQLGTTLNMAIVMLLFALYMGRVQITPEYHGAFLQSARTIFIITAILCFLGIFASLSRGKVERS